IIEPEYDYIEFYQDGIFVVGIKEKKEIDEGALPFDDTVWKYGLIDINGKVLAPPIYIYDLAKVDRMEFHEGLAAVCVNGKWGYINARGEMAIEPRFEEAQNFQEGVAYIKEDGRYGLIDRSGSIVVKPQFTNISTKIKNGYIRVEKSNRKWGVIDKSGHIVVEPAYDYVFGDISEGMSRIQQVESFGFANCRNGNIIAPVFNYVYEFSEGLAVVRLTEEQLTEHSISSDRTD
ncbi:MAG: WG repeat-containing protein, partial [Muribaculaceae bacterium]|nr:WG repeat-containing protein [Muribaculaceae bacterium]